MKNKLQEEIKQEKPKMRQVIIETDGNSINIVKAEVAGNLELIAIINNVLMFLTNPPKQQ
jgi:hypothetical protein